MKKSIYISLSVMSLTTLLIAQSVLAWSNVNLGMRARPFSSMSQQMIMGENGAPISGWVNPETLAMGYVKSGATSVNKGALVPSWDLSKIFRADGGGQLAANFGGFTKLRAEIYENTMVNVWNAPLDNYTGAQTNHPIYSKYFGSTAAPSLLVDRAPVSWSQKFGVDIDINSLNFTWPENIKYDSSKLYRFRLIESATISNKIYSGAVDAIVKPQIGAYANLTDTFGPRLRIGASDVNFIEWPTLYKYTQIVNKDIYDIKMKMKDYNQLAQARAEQDRVRALNATRYQGAVNWIFGSPYFTEGGFMSGGAVAKTIVTAPSYDKNNLTWSDFNIQMPVSPWQDYESGLAKYRVRLMEMQKCNLNADWSSNWIVDPVSKDRIITYKTAVLPESAWANTAGITTVVDRLVNVDDIPKNLFGPIIKITKADYDKLSANVHTNDATVRSCAFVGLTALDSAGNQSWDGLGLFLNQNLATGNVQPTANPVSVPNASGNSAASTSVANATNSASNVSNISSAAVGTTSSWTGTSSAQNYTSTGQLVVNQAAVRAWTAPVTNPVSASSSAPIASAVVSRPTSISALSVNQTAVKSSANTSLNLTPQIPSTNVMRVPAVSVKQTSINMPKITANWLPSQPTVNALNIRAYVNALTSASKQPQVPPSDLNNNGLVLTAGYR